MVIEIIFAAVTRKMLCNPVNSFIADTEFLCAVGITLNALKVDKQTWEKAERTEEYTLLKELCLTCIENNRNNFDTPFQNLFTMIEEYHLENQKITESMREILRYGYQQDFIYPKGNF